ncbi:alpha/beta fold hydrolase [Roseateles sp. BYS180W]|uniref:Cholesterol oxidase n=1 Tax=Roseateles rivi TaxID=3299028 RepID=A0ABW7FWQ0_9BURK
MPEGPGMGVSWRAQDWLSVPLETWWADEGANTLPTQWHADVLVVGSGYGGAAAAQQFAGLRTAQGEPLRVLVLERGREYLPGSFPRSLAELPGHVRFSTPGAQSPRGRRDALFDVRLGPDVCVAQASGLGGGSLINAGVMERPASTVFQGARWPQSLRAHPEQMEPWFAQAEWLVGAVDARGENTIERLSPYPARRLQRLQELDAQARPARITMALDEQPSSSAGLHLQRCVACGDCASGCNQGAKQSLDTNALLQAARQGVRLVCGASVRQLRRGPQAQGWELDVEFSDEGLQSRQGAPLRLRARHVVLAAGSLGSTEILLRSSQQGLALSPLLGRQFSGNGDVIAAGVDLPEAARGVAEESAAPAHRQVGPTITGVLPAGADFVVEDLAIPGPLRALWTQSFALGQTLHALTEPLRGRHRAGPVQADPQVLTEEGLQHMLALAIIGHDDACGELRLSPQPDSDIGTLAVHWPELKNDARVVARHDWVAQRLQAQGASLVANPLWRLLPASMGDWLGTPAGPMISVHPLGGCGMGDCGASGVVNEWGQVFSGLNEAVYEDLVVLDGAMVPSSLGINPALTITALALRALARLRTRWGFRQEPGVAPQQPAPERLAVLAQRPLDGVPDPDAAQPSSPTVVELCERLGGWVHWPGSPGDPLKYLELTLHYAPSPVSALWADPKARVLQLAPGSCLRVFAGQASDQVSGGRQRLCPAGQPLWEHLEPRDEDALCVLPLSSGALHLFERAPSGRWGRTARALWAWFMNRGWRDMVHAAQDALSAQQAPQANEPVGLAARLRRGTRSLAQRARLLLNLASHAGETRLMRYTLALPDAAHWPAAAPAWALALQGQLIEGAKHLRYERRANPWQQLSTLTLQGLPAPLQACPGQRAVQLHLDLGHLARLRQPLLRICQAQDGMTALADVAALLGYITRLMLPLHAWTLRRPDAAPPRQAQRLPGRVPGLPEPEVLELAAGSWGEAAAQRQGLLRAATPDDTKPVLVRLTRYRSAQAQARPILMIHGYSASGTTFAHHSVQPGPAQLLWEAGWDVWVLDMRTSAGLPTAVLPWTFEQVGFNDIPLAVDAVLRATGAAQVDVLAHCMGSVMLHQALMEPERQSWEHFYPLRQQLPSRIRALVISQVTPMMVMSPGNALRALLMQYLRPYLPLQDFSFRPEPAGLLDELIDRLLATLPYPAHEYDLENPPPPRWRRTPWVATRHRMDMLYGRDFAIQNVDQAVFDFIDDHFGPLNMDTVAQAIHFAQRHEITDWQGASRYLDAQGKSLALLQAFPVLSVHGQDNGLCLADSAAWLHAHWEPLAPGRYQRLVVPGHGHQDCLIGRHIAPQVFAHIERFLQEAT